MADNSATLRRARQKDSASKRHLAETAIDAMTQTGEPVNFPAVARLAGVSVSFLYADINLARRIADARDRQSQAGRDRAWRLPARSLVTEQSLRADLANSKDQLRRLSEEVSVLRSRLERDLGAGADMARERSLVPRLDELEARAAELVADNDRLKGQVTALEAEARELTETLEAARAMNRDLMAEINRPPASPEKPALTRSRRHGPSRNGPAV